mgnify:CR=1 FL=1
MAGGDLPTTPSSTCASWLNVLPQLLVLPHSPKLHLFPPAPEKYGSGPKNLGLVFITNVYLHGDNSMFASITPGSNLFHTHGSPPIILTYSEILVIGHL